MSVKVFLISVGEVADSWNKNYISDSRFPDHYDSVLMFGIDKNLKNAVRIDRVAEREGVREKLSLFYGYHGAAYTGKALKRHNYGAVIFYSCENEGERL